MGFLGMRRVVHVGAARRTVAVGVAGLLSAVAAPGCGARSSLAAGDLRGDEGAGGAGGGASEVNGTSSSIGASSGSTGSTGTGAPAVCTTLAWAGDPVLVEVGPPGGEGEASQLQLVQALEDTPTLTWVFRSTTTTEIASATFDAWGVWPPAVPSARTHFVGAAGVASDVAPAPAGMFLQSWRNDLDILTISGVEPVGDTVLTSLHPPLTGQTHAVARGASGDLLVYGPPEIAVATTVPLANRPTMEVPVGCGRLPIVADAVAQADGTFLVASSNDAPFDDCGGADVPGLPTTVLVHKVGPIDVTPAFSFTSGDVIERLQLVSDGDAGAWLVHRSVSDPVLHIERLDGEGRSTWSVAESGNALYGDAVDDWSTGYAHVQTWPGSPDNETAPFVWLTVHGPELVNQVTSIETGLPMQVLGGPPTILTSPDERSMLVAWRTGRATIALWRADCL